MNKLVFLRCIQVLSRYEPNGPMRFIIAIVLGTLMSQGSPLQLPRPRDENMRTGWNFESTTLENGFDHTRKKRSIQSTSGGTEQQTNIRIVRIFHKYQYFLQVSKDGKVKGTKDTINGNGKSGNLNLFLLYIIIGLDVYALIGVVE